MLGAFHHKQKANNVVIFFADNYSEILRMIYESQVSNNNKEIISNQIETISHMAKTSA